LENEARITAHLVIAKNDMSKFKSLGNIIEYPKNTLIQRAGAKPDACYYIDSGWVCGYENSIDGKECFNHLSTEGTLLLESALLLDRTLSYHFKTVTDARLVCIPKEIFFHALKEDPELSILLSKHLSEKFLSANEQIWEQYEHSISWRLCSLLLTFAERYGEDYDKKLLIRKPLSQNLLASMLRANRVTIFRALTEIMDLGCVERINGYYCIRDTESLHEYMNTLEK
jgi:CRP-like cAMP-binding protein